MKQDKETDRKETKKKKKDITDGKIMRLEQKLIKEREDEEGRTGRSDMLK